MPAKKRHISEILWNLWCIISIIGIWPRFIEPKLLSVSKLKLTIPNLPDSLSGFRIVQFSDLHLHPDVSDFFLRKLSQKITSLKPDLLAFTGDYLCYSIFSEKERLRHFFNSLPKAKAGNFAILGNHDYEVFVSLNEEGEYDTLEGQENTSAILKGFKRLFKKLKPKGIVTERAKNVPLNRCLIEFIDSTSFRLLHNETEKVVFNGETLNIVGLGEYMLGKMNLPAAYANYDESCPGVILLHNPDGLKLLKDYPGHLVLCGHTHGGQVNLPLIWDKFVLLEDMHYTKGLRRIKDKWAYISRGVGSVLNFRWFSVPEITLIELV